MGRENVTVNGKSLSEVFQALTAPIEGTQTRKDGTVFIDIQAFEKRINSVVGIMNYNLEFDSAQLVEVEGVHTMIVRAVFELISDDGDVVLKRAANGGSDVVIVNVTGKPDSVKSAVDSAQSEAFKNICKRMNIGVGQLRAEGYRKEKSAGSASDVSEICITFQSSINTKKGRYVAEAVDSNGEKVEFVLFKRKCRY